LRVEASVLELKLAKRVSRSFGFPGFRVALPLAESRGCRDDSRFIQPISGKPYWRYSRILVTYRLYLGPPSYQTGARRRFKLSSTTTYSSAAFLKIASFSTIAAQNASFIS
jgi:hypothetical protein